MRHEQVEVFVILVFQFFLEFPPYRGQTIALRIYILLCVYLKVLHFTQYSMTRVVLQLLEIVTSFDAHLHVLIIQKKNEYFLEIGSKNTRVLFACIFTRININVF